MKMKRLILILAMAFAVAGGMTLAQAPQGGPPGGGQGGPGGGAGGRQGGGQRGPAFNVTSPSFQDGGEIPLKYSFYGENVSPQFDFHWFTGMNPAEQPPAVQTFAIIFRDMENATNRGPADTLHWSAFNIPATSKSLPEGIKAGEQPDRDASGAWYPRRCEWLLLRTWRRRRPVSSLHVRVLCTRHEAGPPFDCNA